MLNEEEKKLVEKFKNLYIKHFNGKPITVDDRFSYIESVLITNLIEKLDKELNNLKEIEKSHKEENGKLRVELEQEKEKNKKLEEYITDKIEIEDEIQTYISEKFVEDQYINKDKIKEKIKELEKEQKEYEESQEWEIQDDLVAEIMVLEELLEEK